MFANVHENFENNLKNSFHLDYLTVRFLNFSPHELLSVFCESVCHKDINVNLFDKFYKGALTSYNRSYKFVGENYITINWKEEFDENLNEYFINEIQGICLNITGTGFSLIDLKSLKKFFSKINSLGVSFNVTRLDVCYDDFLKKIPFEKMYKAVESWQKGGLTINTRSKRQTCKLFTNGFTHNKKHFVAKNFSIGSNYSEIKLRLYDKKVEKKIINLDYWKRLELQLRSVKANNFLNELLNDFSLNLLFVDYLTDGFRFLKSHNRIENTSNVKDALFWKKFIDYISSQECIFSEEFYNFKDFVCEYVRLEEFRYNNPNYFYSFLNAKDVILKSFDCYLKQYGNLVELVKLIDFEYYLKKSNEIKFSFKNGGNFSKYNNIYFNIINGNLNETSLKIKQYY